MTKRERRKIRKQIVEGLLERGFVPVREEMVDGDADDGFRATRPVVELPHAKLMVHFALDSGKYGGDQIAGRFKLVLDAAAVRELCPGPVGDFWLRAEGESLLEDPELVLCRAHEVWSGRPTNPSTGVFSLAPGDVDEGVQFILESLDKRVYDAVVMPVTTAAGLRAKTVHKFDKIFVSAIVFRSGVALLYSAGYPDLAEDAIAEYYTHEPRTADRFWVKAESREQVDAFVDWVRSVPRSTWGEFCGGWTLPPGPGQAAQ